MNTLEILKAARELISDPKRFTSFAAARNRDSVIVDEQSADAVCWCSVGAIHRVAPDVVPIGFHSVYESLRRGIGGGSIVTFNDTHTHAEVLAMFDKAIASLEGVQL